MPSSVTVALTDEAVVAQPDLRELYDAHGPAVRSLARRLLGCAGEGDDLAQEVFLLAWRKRAALSRTTARAFLFAATVKLAAAQRRRAKVRRLFALAFRPQHELDWRTPERAAEAHDAHRLVYQSLDGLPENRRTVFILHELQGMTAEEIAEATGCPVKTVWTRFYKARQEFLDGLHALGATNLVDLPASPASAPPSKGEKP